MKNKRLHLIPVLMLCLLLASCTRNEFNSSADYLRWMDSEESGLVTEHRLNGMCVKAKYLPVDYLIYRDAGERPSPAVCDSLRKLYENSVTFLLSFGPDESKGASGDVMYKGLRNYQEYVERAVAMNFDLERMISLQTGGKEWSPVLSAMENTYGLTQTRNVLLVFPVAQLGAGNPELIYRDELFELGNLHFKFDKEKITNLPALAGITK